jgi:integrase
MNYTPSSIQARAWKNVGPFVFEAVSRCSGRTAYSDSDLFQTVSRLTAWVRASSKAPLTDAIFSPATIEAFIADGLPTYSAASRRNRRSILLRVSEEILGEKAARVRLESLPSSNPSTPSTPAEVTRLRRWADRSDAARRPQAQVLVALALEFGLSTCEIIELRRGDIAEDGDTVAVHVTSGRDRSVTVAGEWGSRLLESVTDLGDEDWVFCPKRRGGGGGGKNMISNFVARDSRAGLKPNAQRMRATWTVGRLEAGAPAIQLMRDSGIQSMEALNRFTRFVDAA